MANIMWVPMRFASFLIVLLCFTHVICAGNCSHATELILHEYRVEGNKIYIQPSQLNITNEGIFVTVQIPPPSSVASEKNDSQLNFYFLYTIVLISYLA